LASGLDETLLDMFVFEKWGLLFDEGGVVYMFLQLALLKILHGPHRKQPQTVPLVFRVFFAAVT
jgi:hypothetical protein